MAILKGELQTDKGDVLYPHTSANVVFGKDGKSVEEQIDILSNGIKNRGLWDSGAYAEDADLMKKQGWYVVYGGCKNFPIPNAGLVEVKNFDAGGSIVKQTYSDITNNATWERWFKDNAWTPWEDKISVLNASKVDINNARISNSIKLFAGKNDVAIYKYSDLGIISVTGEIRQNNIPIATTEKINILVTPDSGYTIIDQYNFQINNVIHYNLRIKKTDGGNFSINTSIPCFSIPSGKITYDTAFCVIGADANQYSKTVFCVASASTLKCYVVVKDTGTKEVRISGTVVL